MNLRGVTVSHRTYRTQGCLLIMAQTPHKGLGTHLKIECTYLTSLAGENIAGHCCVEEQAFHAACGHSAHFTRQS